MEYKFKPYSQNIIFFDTEFSSMDPYGSSVIFGFKIALAALLIVLVGGRFLSGRN